MSECAIRHRRRFGNRLLSFDASCDEKGHGVTRAPRVSDAQQGRARRWIAPAWFRFDGRTGFTRLFRSRLGIHGAYMLEWMKKRGSTPPNEPKADPGTAAPRQGRSKAGKYRLLYDYLENRYANTVVLTFGQIEDLLGFTLPDLARTDLEWWTIADMRTTEARCSDAWTLASRTAKPNLMAQTVIFERVS